jgi:hypothetical protein
MQSRFGGFARYSRSVFLAHCFHNAEPTISVWAG